MEKIENVLKEEEATKSNSNNKGLKVLAVLGLIMILGTVVYAAWQFGWEDSFNGTVSNKGTEFTESFVFSDIAINTSEGQGTNVSHARLNFKMFHEDVLFEIEENWTLWDGGCDATGDCSISHMIDGLPVVNGSIMNMSMGNRDMNTTITCIEQSCAGAWEITWKLS